MDLSSTQNAVSQSEPPEPQHAWCDRCFEKIRGTRSKCQQCRNFDYCETCVQEAALIHPGHTFSAMVAADDHEEEEEVEVKAVAETNREPDQKCISCHRLSEALAASHLAGGPEKRGMCNEMSVTWTATLSKLIEATQRGCGFCAMVLYGFFRSSNFEVLDTSPKKPWYAEPLKHDKDRTELVQHCMGTMAKLKADQFVLIVNQLCTKPGAVLPDFDRIRITISTDTYKYNSQEELKKASVFHSAGIQKIERDVFVEKDNVAAEHISSRPPNANTVSSQAMEQFRDWMKVCDEHHGAACRPRSRLFPPSRVIKLFGSDEDMLGLHETTPDQEGQYAALSYCWGGPQSFATTITTINSRKNTGFSLKELPMTLQDAVRVAKGLQIPYLWVDSMCIVQDDAEDKRREIAKMADIYKNAAVTICAARSLNVDEGFLKDESDPSTGLWKAMVPMSWRMPSADATTMEEALGTTSSKMHAKRLGTLWISSEQMHWVRSRKDNVSSRSWCLQEQVLSPRFLSFSTWPMWRCSRSVASNGGFFIHNGQHDSRDRHFTSAVVRMLQDPQEEEEEVDDDTGDMEGGGSKIIATSKRTTASTTDVFATSQLLTTWRGLVEDYTKRRVTLESDRLPAIGGVAREMARLMAGGGRGGTGIGPRYAAGLWDGNMLQDLMWYTAGGKEWRARPDVWRAPSWSWAAVDVPVLYDAVTPDSIPVGRVLDCMLSSSSDDDDGGFEGVTGGTVVVRGPFRELAEADIRDVVKRQSYAPPVPLSGDVQEWYAQNLAYNELTESNRAVAGSSSPRNEEFGTTGFSPQGGDDEDEEDDARPLGRVFAQILFTRDWVASRWDPNVAKKMTMCYSGLLLREMEGQVGSYERVGAFVNDDSGFFDQSIPWREETVKIK